MSFIKVHSLNFVQIIDKDLVESLVKSHLLECKRNAHSTEL